MALNHGYGVVAGVKEDYFRDPPNDYGQYFHGNLRLRTPAGVYHCAIDVDSKAVPNGVQWRIIELRPVVVVHRDDRRPDRPRPLSKDAHVDRHRRAARGAGCRRRRG